VAAAFAILVGKAVFGGVGHFLWQPALVGRLAVAVLFPATMNPAAWPVLAQDRLLVGDLNNAAVVDSARLWRGTPAPERADALAFRRPEHILSDLTDSTRPAFSALNYVPADLPRAKPAALRKMPPIEDLLLGTHPGGLGETSAFAIAIALLYLVYRSYIKWQLPLAMVLAAATVAAIAPVYLAGPNLTVRQVWWPVTAEGFDVGIVYVTYQVLTGELLLAALLATEMTSRPVTTNGRIVFGLGCGAVGMLMRLFLETPIPFYMAVLAMNTLTPTIEAICRPRVFGRSRLEWLKRRQAECGQNTTTN
jgi:electron transport complex protein RnfD